MSEEYKNIKQYDDLANELRHRVAQLGSDQQLWIGLSGAPGSGKSTLAEALKERLSNLLSIIPMDGYHHYCSELENMENPADAFACRGAPFTFNSTKFVDDLIKSHDSGEGKFPSFDHSVGDPIEANIYLTKSHKIVLVEGNYILLDTEPWCQLRHKVFNETWFLDIPIEESNRRVKSRHMKLGLSEKEAEHRVATNDGINAKFIVEISAKYANRMIHIHNTED